MPDAILAKNYNGCKAGDTIHVTSLEIDALVALGIVSGLGQPEKVEAVKTDPKGKGEKASAE